MFRPLKVLQSCYSKEEFARRGNEIYESHLCPQVKAVNHGKIVAINIGTGAFEVADTAIAATDQLYERYADTQS